MRLLLALLFLVNIAGLGYNGWRSYERVSEEDPIKRDHDLVISMRQRVLAYRSDIDRVRKDNIISVDDETTYFRDQATKVWPNPDQVLQLQSKAETKKSGGFLQSVWKISLGTPSNREQTFKIGDVAKYCELIESGSPQFQIKEIDMAKRSDIWGKNEWKAKSIAVRRVTRAEEKK